MKITAKAWLEYITGASSISQKAIDLMQAWIDKNGTYDRDKLIEYANALVQHYGQASGALSCKMYEATAEAQGVTVQTAEIAALPEYEAVGKAVNGTLKQSQNVADTVGRLVKQVGADTTLKNGRRDGAEWAWVPHGDTCAFCITLASRGWQKMSWEALKGNHAEHIHANCDCEYAIRFDGKSTVEGYDPDKYLEMYNSAKGNDSQAKINALRRANYAKNKDSINARKRELYASKKQPLNSLITNLKDEYVIKSVGSKLNNYDIMDLTTGEMYHFAEGTKLQNKEVFAGKGSKKEYRNAAKYADKYGGVVDEWQHVKAEAVLETVDGEIPAEVHWSQCEGIGKKDFFVKRWLDES